MVISKGILKKGELNNKVAVITGAGGGIGYEAARSLLWLGAKVVIAEIDKAKGKKASTNLTEEFGPGRVLFIKADIGNERHVRRLIKKAKKVFGQIDILINNATVTPIGAVHEVGIKNWDKSYRTNLRGPVILTSAVLPQMLDRDMGVIMLVTSSGAAPYLGAYEVFKTAQVELANTLAAELEKTGVITFAIGPGIVKTETANKAIEQIAPLYGKSVDEFYRMSENALLTVEEAGAGFAAAATLASRYRGLEIGSIQALTDMGLSITEQMDEAMVISIREDTKQRILILFNQIKETFIEQITGWSDRSIFERQWLIRDFKKQMGAAPESYFESFKRFEQVLGSDSLTLGDLNNLPLDKIFAYYQHQIRLLKGYEKNPEKVREYTETIQGWLHTITELNELIRGSILYE